MGDKLFLLFMLLLSVVNSHSQTSTPTNSKEVSNKVEESDGSSADASPLPDSESTIRYSIVDPVDEKGKKEKPDTDVASSEDDPEELLLIESLIGDEDKFPSDTFSETNTNEYGDDNGLKFLSVVSEDPILASNTDEVEVRRQGEVNPEFERTSTARSSFGESPENQDDQSSSSPPYEPASDQLFRRDPNTDSSPLLQLTQGGYQRPYQTTDRFRNQRQRVRSESATQQSETVETPNSNSNNGERIGRAQIPNRNAYASIFQPPFGFAPGPIFRHPFMQQTNGFTNPNRDIQNSFYNTQPNSNQGQYAQLDNTGNFPNVHFSVQTAPRAPVPNPGYLFQAPFQIPSAQSVPANPPRQIPAFFQPGPSPGYSNYDSSVDTNGPEYMGLFGNAAPPMNPHFQESSNLYGANPNFGGNIFANPPLSLMSNFQNSDDGSQFSSRFLNYPPPGGRVSVQNANRQQVSDSSPNDSNEKQADQISEALNKEDPTSVPFGTRIQRQNGDQDRSDVERQDNVYIRYPLTEAGYATEENLPVQNDTEKKTKDNDGPVRQPFPFFSVPRRYNVFNGPDPYKIALENVQRGYPNGRSGNSDNKNSTGDSRPEQLVRDLPLVLDQSRPDAPTQIFRAYPERNPDLSIPNAQFYPLQGSDRNPFEPISLFPDNNYQFSPPRPPGESNVIPACAKKSNASLCFEDPEYPRGELLYALNSDSFLMDRLVMPDQQLEGIALVEQNTTESPESEDNYICKSDIKYGLPLRAQNIRGNWKVIVNMERAIGRGKFVQPVRLEVCRGAGVPCSFTQIKTACVQKYSLQRLLSWSAEKGVHNDVYKLPVACSCQIVDVKA